MPPLLVRRVAAVIAATLVGAVATAALPAYAAGHHLGPAEAYVALGDSFAAGEGLPPYAAGTDTATDLCHRSTTQSYPELLQAGRRREFDHLTSRACSGAGTAALLTDAPDDADEPAQLGALTVDTTTVTLTVGGNDVGFATVLGGCLYSPVPQVQAALPGVGAGCRNTFDGLVTARTVALAGGTAQPGTVSIATLVLAIRARSPHARIYVSGYPQLLGTAASSPLGCQVSPTLPIYLSSDDITWLRTKTRDLNAAIRTGVATARAAGASVRYVGVGRDFAGHGVCDTRRSWINPLLLTPGADPTAAPTVARASFHPTSRGQQAYAHAFARRSCGPVGPRT